MNKEDIVIVGGGIAGISLAWHLRKRGRSVTLLEKAPALRGASVRNFGMVWEVGQVDAETERLAARSHEFWSAAAAELGFWHRRVGSLHLAYEELEAQVLSEYLDLVEDRRDRKMITPEEVSQLVPMLRTEGLVAAMHSTTEGVVEPKVAVPRALEGLKGLGVTVRTQCPVAHVGPGRVQLSNGETLLADQVAVCAGPELVNFLPEVWRAASLKECWLQMLRLRPKPGTPRLNIHLCAGLTLGHYANFRRCPSLPEVLELHREKWPSQVEAAIHILVSEHEEGTLTLGDSHYYGQPDAVTLKESVYESILAAMDEFLPRELYEVHERWQGVYPTHSEIPYWFDQVDEGVWAVSLFGTGMTLSWGVTELLSNRMEGGR